MQNNQNHAIHEQPSAMPAMTFRAHHLKAQELKHTNSFSSMSSYASSIQSDSENASSHSSSGQEGSPTKKTTTTTKRRNDRRPGGGTSLRPAGKAHDWYS